MFSGMVSSWQAVRRLQGALTPGVALQAKFQALEELSELRQLVQKCLAEGIKSWNLYTTPPKQACRWHWRLPPLAHILYHHNWKITRQSQAQANDVKCTSFVVMHLQLFPIAWSPGPGDQGLQAQLLQGRPRPCSQCARQRLRQGSSSARALMPAAGGAGSGGAGPERQGPLAPSAAAASGARGGCPTC
jgi:hypothetical protein